VGRAFRRGDSTASCQAESSCWETAVVRRAPHLKCSNRAASLNTDPSEPGVLVSSSAKLMELSLFDRDHPGHAARGGDHVSVRQAAEALFTPKPPALKRPEVAAESSASPQFRQPRVLGISAPQPRRQEDVEPLRPAPATTQKRIADTEAARVKTWVKYGMTIPQVAKVYGVTLMEVQRVLREG